MSESVGEAPTIDGYEYRRPIGHGGFSDVYLYEQVMPRRDVAVKVMRTDALTDANRRQFNAEANLMARLSNHSNIASIFAADVDDDGQPYLVMEYCSGGSLGDHYRNFPMALKDVLKVGVRMCSALEAAHRAGIIHRDIKPSNILLTEYSVPVLSDFGISTIDEEFPEATMARAQVYSGDVKSETDSVGMSLPWAAPETLGDPPISDTRSDRYSLAATLFSLLEGRSPHEVPGGPNSASHLTGRIQTGFVATMKRSDVPESLRQILRKGLAYDRAQRFPSSVAFGEALQGVQRELGLEVTPLDVPRGSAPAAEPPSPELTRLRPAPAEIVSPVPHGQDTWIPGAAPGPAPQHTSGPAPAVPPRPAPGFTTPPQHTPAPGDVHPVPTHATRPPNATGPAPHVTTVPPRPAATVPPRPASAAPSMPSATVPPQLGTPVPPRPGTPVPPRPGSTVPPMPTATVPPRPAAALGQPRPQQQPHSATTQQTRPQHQPQRFLTNAPAPTAAGPQAHRVGAPGRRTPSARMKVIAGIGIGALVIGIVIFAAKLIAGSPETFEGRSIDNIHPEMNNGGVYEFTIPDGLESPENAESRLLQSGSGDVATTESTITISTDYTGWITGVPDTLNPTETQSYGAEVTLTAADLGEAMAASMDGATEGSIYLVAAPEGYFLNRAPQLEVESSYAQLVVVLIVDVS